MALSAVHHGQQSTYFTIPMRKLATQSAWQNRGQNPVTLCCYVHHAICSDDIDPSNGWVPTDIFVRIYDEDQNFPPSQHYRIDPEEQPRITQASGFFPRIQALTAKISEYHGFLIANEYDGWGEKQSIWPAVNVSQ